MRCDDGGPLLSLALDGALDARSARALAAHLEACPACRAAQRDLAAEHHALAELWTPLPAPAGFARRVAPMLERAPVVQGRRWRPSRPVALVMGAAVVALAALVAVEPMRAGLDLFIRQVVLRQESAPGGPPRTLPLRVLSLDEAQRLVPWRIRQPASLPEGYRLARVSAGEIHAFAAGTTVVLDYQAPTARHLRIVELQARERLDEPVAPGAARTVSIAGRTGLLIDGQWVERDGHGEWQYGRLLRLIVEDGDLVFQLEADPRDGWDADGLIAVAASL